MSLMRLRSAIGYAQMKEAGVFGGRGAVVVLFRDTFTGANGTLLTEHTPDVDFYGGGWGPTFANYQSPGPASINTNMAAITASAVAVGGAVAETHHADVVITADVTTISSVGFSGNGIVFRYQDDANYWTVELASSVTMGILKIVEWAAGVQTIRASTPCVIAANTAYALMVTVYGNEMWATIGTTTITHNSSAKAAQTKHGILMNRGSTAPAFSRVDNFAISRITSIPNLIVLQNNYLSLGFGALIHWNMQSFTDGIPAAGIDVNTFAPSDLDIDQWLDACVSAGMQYATLTATHGDGFALWPTAFAVAGHDPYSIAQTTWYANNGSPDVVGLFVAKCRERNLKPCLYYSIDDSTYVLWSGTDEQTGSAAYTTRIKAQLTELLTNYGEIAAIWFDGWGYLDQYAYVPYGPIYSHVKAVSPNTLVINNDQTHSPNTSEIVLYETTPIPEGNTYPAEAVYTIRADNHWFYVTTDAPGCRTVAALRGLIANANGNYANLQLGLTPDRTGHLPADQVTRLGEIPV